MGRIYQSDGGKNSHAIRSFGQRRTWRSSNPIPHPSSSLNLSFLRFPPSSLRLHPSSFFQPPLPAGSRVVRTYKYVSNAKMNGSAPAIRPQLQSPAVLATFQHGQLLGHFPQHVQRCCVRRGHHACVVVAAFCLCPLSSLHLVAATFLFSESPAVLATFQHGQLFGHFLRHGKNGKPSSMGQPILLGEPGNRLKIRVRG